MVMPRRTPMPAMTPRFGTSSSTSREAGLLKSTRLGSSCFVMGLSSTPLFRGSTLPSATKATRPRSASCFRAASWSSTDRMWDLSLSSSSARKKRLFFTTSMRPPTICAARWPSTLRPRAGRLSVSRASTCSAVTTTLVRGSTNWPGASTLTSPPLLPPQPPPDTAFVQSVPVPPCSMSESTRVRKSQSATLRTGECVAYSAGNFALLAGSLTRTQEGGA
mmetsp:Transcript_54520/g.174864  ORF Transcript_54520/g.174864 Transcript_54520/m.174864 type:complete len:220 (-) Transcript_54520:313-972(-)